jgi:ribose transport system ATP-binding protein
MHAHKAVMPAANRKPASSPEEILRMAKVSKSFIGTLALDGVDFDLRQGECHILFGENGAGKSTLIQILAGVFPPTTGTITFAGSPIEIQSVHHSRSLGISAVFQEFSIAPSLTVAENLFLGSEPRKGPFLDHRQARAEARRILDGFGFRLDLDRLAGDLSRAEKQMLEIARAFRSPPSVLILDEPTASLTDSESEQLFALIGQLKRQGVGIIYITHRMHEIARIGDRVTVLRDGRLIATLAQADVSVDRLISLMTGRSKAELFPQILCRPGEKKLEVNNLSTRNGRVSQASFNVRAGEIVGIAGLIGSGKGDIGPACLGATSIQSGEIRLAGRDVTGFSPRRSLEAGLCYVPSDRRADGLFLQHDICQNLSIASLAAAPIRSHGFVNRSREKSLAREVVKRLSVRPSTIDTELARLSGGNQQKVMIGRFIARNAQIYILDEPTVGVDVGARHTIYEQIKSLCEEGAAILLISSDMSEILNLAHRSYVMHQGRIVGECGHDELSEEKLLHLMFGEVSDPSPTHLPQHSAGGLNGARN